MRTSTVRKSFGEADQTLSLSHTYKNGVYYHMILTIQDAAYAEHIKDICIEHIHPFFEDLSLETIDSDMIERLLEENMQKVNHVLSLFAEQVQADHTIAISGGLIISYQGNLIASLIGQSSIIVCREDKAIYSMANTTDDKTTIDHFTDYITGAIHKTDHVLLIGNDHTLFFHQKELDELATIIDEGEDDMLSTLESHITQRIEPELVRFMSLVNNASNTLHMGGLHKKAGDLMQTISSQPWARMIEPVLFIIKEKKYIVSVAILGIIVLGYIYSIIAGAIKNPTNDTTITTEEGVQVVTIEDIKKDIAYFQNLDPTSNEKSKVYQDITQKLDFLESKNRRPEDVKQLRKIVQNKYYEGFRIAYINQLDDLNNGGEFQKSYTFTDYEAKLLGSPLNVYYERGFIVGGTKGAILKGISNDIKGTAVDYALTSTMKKCSQDLSRAGLYCFDDTNSIYRVSAGSIQPVQGNENVSLPTDIQDIGVFGKSNMYLLVNPTSNGGADVIRRLRNELGSFTVFKDSIGYSATTDGSGNALMFNSMLIDGTFLVRSPSDKKLYQLWRENNPNKLNQRIVPIQGGDVSTTAYSDKVKIIASASSNYVYLFDQEKQTFTVYKASPLKTNTANTNSYSLIYIMRYNFDLTNKIIDVAIPEELGSKPILYIMNSQGIYQTNLIQTIEVFESKAAQE